jgi:hypothetical protein
VKHTILPIGSGLNRGNLGNLEPHDSSASIFFEREI